MKISQDGIRRIVGYESKLKKLGGGRYIAYLCPAGVWTIYAGCTKGVHEGMIVTEEQGEAMFATELERCEKDVTKLVTVDINQNEFDALVSFVYNCGPGALQNSSILRRLNNEDRAGAARAFHLYNKARDPRTRKLRVLRGLVSRRASESALFLKPVAAPEEPFMPQAVEASKEPPKPATVAVGTCAAGGLAMPFLPSIPTPPVEAVSSVAGWQSAAETLGAFASSRYALYAICAMVVFGWIVPALLNKRAAQ